MPILPSARVLLQATFGFCKPRLMKALPRVACARSTQPQLPFESSFFNAQHRDQSMRVRSVALGAACTLCVSEKGELYSFGSGELLGHASSGAQVGPKCIEFFEGKGVLCVDCSIYHSAAVTADGHLYVWGRGGARLGLGAAVDHAPQPTRVAALRNV